MDLVFPTTRSVEAGFSAVNDVLTKKHNLSQIEKKGNLHVKLNQSST